MIEQGAAPLKGKSPGWVSWVPAVRGWCPREGRALPGYGLGTPSTAHVLLFSGCALP